MKIAIVFFTVLAIPVIAFSETISVPGDYPTIQEAITASVGGDTILVSPGTYVENIDFKGKAITVMSEQGTALTIIDGNQAGSVVAMKGKAVLDGFTITNGLASIGGGVYAGYATIKNNIITGNIGSGICCYDSVVTNNIISYNTESGIRILTNGGSLVTFNTITENSDGGICCLCASPSIINNIISYNSSNYHGGGIRWINPNAIASPIPDIVNCVIYGNSSSSGGGGLYFLGFALWPGTIKNTILWNNEAPAGPEIYLGQGSYASIEYSALCGGMNSVFESGGTLFLKEGIIDADPLFVDPDKGDFHLSILSSCINRGTNDGAPPVDFEGDPRPYMGTVDMGADEFVWTHALAADKFSVSEATGGSVNFTLTGGQDNNGRTYIILGSVSGTAPGIALPGGKATLPVNWDAFSDVVLVLLNTPVFYNFLGTLDGSGTAAAQLNAPPVSGFAGMTMYYAYALNAPWDFVSNPVAIEIVF